MPRMHFKKGLFGLLAGVALLASVMVAHPAAALFNNAKNNACQGIALNNSNGCATPATGLTLDKVIASVINIASVIVGVVSVIMIIVGGSKYITSGGDSTNVGNAKNTIVYAVVGLVIVALAQTIVQFVLTKTTSPPNCPAGRTAMPDGSACIAKKK